MDRDKWLGFVESAGMAQAVENWMESNRKRRKDRIIGKGIQTFTCEEVQGMNFKESLVMLGEVLWRNCRLVRNRILLLK